MFEDLARNLIVPKKLGMTTVLVAPQGTGKLIEEELSARGRSVDDIDFISDDLVVFLDGVLNAVGARP
jgi:putative hydrolase of the HAD superfamily